MGTLSPPPAESLLDTLRGMDMFDLISRSFFSRTLSTHLKSLNLQNAWIGVILQNPPKFEFKVSHVSAELVCSADPVSVKIVGNIYKNSNDHRKTFDITSGCLNFTARDYLLHFLDVFDKPSIDVIYQDEDWNDENLLKNIAIREFMCKNFKKPDKILQHVSNSANCLRIYAQLPPCSSAHQILTKNFKKVTVQFPVFDLNSLLSMTTPFIRIESTKPIREKDLNFFLKHWMYGVSNCNLKDLAIIVRSGEVDLNGRAICKGVWCQEQPQFLRRTYTFKDPMSCNPRTMTVHGGYDIQRNDGVRATFNYSYGCFYFLVWD